MSEAPNPSRPLTADGPVVHDILRTLEHQNDTLKAIQNEAKENTRTLQQMQVQSATFSEKMIQLAEGQRNISGSVEHVAVIENRLSNLEDGFRSYKVAVWAAVTFTTASILSLLGILFKH